MPAPAVKHSQRCLTSLNESSAPARLVRDPPPKGGSLNGLGRPNRPCLR
jgi:hypothetical protein